jgi:hypothetical protein
MPPKSLLILIEGDHDRIFFDKVIKPLLEKKYHPVLPRKYAELGKTSINTLINTFKENGNDYIFVTDIDKAKCISGKKQERVQEYSSIDDKQRIIVVKKEIESWYIAGLTDDKCNELGFEVSEDTCKSGKGAFKRLMEKSGFKSEKDFMQEILKSFDIETAKHRNISFKYFVDKYCLG